MSGSTHVPNLQLIVNDRLDRETVCPLTLGESNAQFEHLTEYSATDFIIDSDRLSKDPVLNSVLEGPKPASHLSQDCVISLRVASSEDNVQLIHQINVYVQDINDNPPVWTKQSIILYFKDGDKAGTKQPIPLATDADLGTNAVISYRLQDVYTESSIPNFVAQNEEMANLLRATAMFELAKEPTKPNSGGDALFLVAKHDIDREARPQGWDLVLIASNVGAGQMLSSQLAIHINITDINDNAPKFSRSLYQPQLPNQRVGVVPEVIDIGYTLLQVHATDADEGENAAVTYGFAPSAQLPMIQQFFEITQKGELKVRQRLQVDQLTRDRGLNQSVYLPTSPITFDVQAVDGADPVYAKTGYATIKLQIEDVDDESPVIRVHPVRPWDGPLHSNSQASTETEVTVTENEPAGQLIALIEVLDPDKQSQEIIRCNLLGETSHMFRLTQQDMVGKEYRLFTASKLDREEMARVAVVIECRDLVDHISSTTIGVNIYDVNDHSPKFKEAFYQFSIFEDDGERDPVERIERTRKWLTPDGRAFVQATDNDEGKNEHITYHLKQDRNISGQSEFQIDTKTGEVSAVGPLDREQSSKYRFIVLAIDDGQPQLTGSCVVEVTILDVNDNLPIFVAHQMATGSYTFSVMENLLPGVRVGKVEAFDLDHLPSSFPRIDVWDPVGLKDENLIKAAHTQHGTDRLTFSLKDESDSRVFWIDPKSGVIITRSVLDREKQAVYAFHVIVRDGPNSLVQSKSTSGASSSPVKDRVHEVSIMVTVTVEDENDNDPVFVRPNSTNHMVLLDPTAIPGQSLLQLLATDPDDGPNGLITYAIRGGNSGNLFNVDPRTGLVYLENPIPRKAIVEAAAVANAASHVRLNENSARENDLDSSAPVSTHVPTHTTYLLAVEACDQGEKKRCTHFPNLQIQLRVPSDGSSELAAGNFAFNDGISTNQLLLGHSGTGADTFLVGGLRRDRQVGNFSVVEIIVITLSIFFSLLIIGIVIAVCFVRKKAQDYENSNRRKELPLTKGSEPAFGNAVEMMRKSNNSHSCSSKVPCMVAEKRYTSADVGSHWNTLNSAEAGKANSTQHTGIRLFRNPNVVNMQKSANHLTEMSQPDLRCPYGAAQLTVEYGQGNTSFPVDPSEEQYQSLKGWTAPHTHRLELYPTKVDLSGNFNIPQSSLCHGEEKEYDVFQTGYEATVDNECCSPDTLTPNYKLTDVRENAALADKSVEEVRKFSIKPYSGFPKSSFV